MDKGRLFVHKQSNCKTAAIVCAVLKLAMGAFALFEGVLAVIAGFAVGSDMIEYTTALVIAFAVSVMMAAQSAYAFYGVLVSHRTLKHIGIAWVIYPVVFVLSRLSISYMNYVQALTLSDMIKQDVDILGIASNAVVLLICFAIGAAMLLYEQGKLSDKRILLYLSAAAYAIDVTVAVIQYIGFYTQTDSFSSMMATALVTSVVIAMGSCFITYGVPFFLALSMKNTSE